MILRPTRPKTRPVLKKTHVHEATAYIHTLKTHTPIHTHPHLHTVARPPPRSPATRRPRPAPPPPCSPVSWPPGVCVYFFKGGVVRQLLGLEFPRVRHDTKQTKRKGRQSPRQHAYLGVLGVKKVLVCARQAQLSFTCVCTSCKCARIYRIRLSRYDVLYAVRTDLPFVGSPPR